MRKLEHERRMHAFRESTGKRSRANLHPEPPEPSKHRVALEVRDFVCKPLRLDSDFAQHTGRRDDKPTVMQPGFFLPAARRLRLLHVEDIALRLQETLASWAKPRRGNDCIKTPQTPVIKCHVCLSHLADISEHLNVALADQFDCTDVDERDPCPRLDLRKGTHRELAETQLGDVSHGEPHEWCGQRVSESGRKAVHRDRDSEYGDTEDLARDNVHWPAHRHCHSCAMFVEIDRNLSATVAQADDQNAPA